MPTKATAQLADLYRSWVATMAAKPDLGIDALRRMFSHWGDLTVDPRAVDYLEIEIAGIPAIWAVPHRAAKDRVLLCAHGGGCVVGSMYSHRKLFAHIAKAVGCRALIVDYRLAPENPHPGPVNDMAAAYRFLLKQENIAPERIGFTGDSAGGSLALTTIARARALGLPLPAASMPMSPWAGCDTSGASYDSNAGRDVLISRQTTEGLGRLFLAGGDPKDPLANPLYIDYAGFPPLYFQVGGAEALLDDSRRMAERARAAGVEVRIDVFPDMQHVFEILAGAAPEADEAIARMGQWMKPHLGLA